MICESVELILPKKKINDTLISTCKSKLVFEGRLMVHSRIFYCINLIISCGHVVTDFRRESKTRCSHKLGDIDLKKNQN